MSLTNKNQGVPGRASSGFSLPLDKVSGQVAGAYSTRLIRSAYTGPVVRVRRNSDSTQLDFISDVTGNLSNVSSAVSIASWLSATTGNVSTWYDQSGGSNNFTQSITSQQPQIVQNGGKWVVWFNRDATPTFYSNLSCATTMTGIKTIVYNFNTIYNGYQTILGAEQYDNTGFRFSLNRIIGGATIGRLGQDFLAAAGSYWYLNGAYGYMISNDGTTGVPSGNYTYNDLAWNHVVGVQNGGGMDGFGFNSISSPNLSIKDRAMNGYMSEIILFRNQLSAADSLYLYNSRYISRGSQIALTCTPLFSQLSSGATSSAVGAFSLRAVNGVSTRAVQVQAHPVVQWPPIAMTSNTTVVSGQLYGNGTYVATASVPNNGIWAIFDNNINTYYEQATAFPYNYTTGTYIGSNATTISSVSVSGEWFQVQLPTSIILRSYTLVGRQDNFWWAKRNPTTFWIAGSNDGTTWSNVHQQTNITPPQQGITINVPVTSNSVSYTYYRLVVNVIGNSNYIGDQRNLVNLASWNLFGDSPSYAPNAAQDFYADRLGNLLTAPVVGQSLANWLGGATGYVTTWYDQSGCGNHATQGTAANQPTVTVAPSGNGYVPVFTSPSPNKYLSIPSSINLGAINGSYTKSLWTYVTSNVNQYQNFLATSTAATGQGIHSIGWNFGTGSGIPYFTAGQNNYPVNLVSTTFPSNTWTHLAVTYNNPTQTFIMYRNGTQVYSNTAYTSSFNAGDGLLPTNFRIGVGYGNACNSQNYDVNIFNTALSATDITTLYNSRIY
jgi:hypothetical protein